MRRVNGYNGSPAFNSRKPYSINRYGLLESKGLTSAFAPDNFKNYGNNRYWYMSGPLDPRRPQRHLALPGMERRRGAAAARLRSQVSRGDGKVAPRGTWRPEVESLPAVRSEDDLDGLVLALVGDPYESGSISYWNSESEFAHERGLDRRRQVGVRHLLPIGGIVIGSPPVPAFALCAVRSPRIVRGDISRGGRARQRRSPAADGRPRRPRRPRRPAGPPARRPAGPRAHRCCRTASATVPCPRPAPTRRPGRRGVRDAIESAGAEFRGRSSPFVRPRRQFPTGGSPRWRGRNGSLPAPPI